MKPIIIAFMLGPLIVGGIAYKLGYLSNVTSYSNQASERIIDNTPDWALDEEAKAAAQAVVRRKELEARLEVLNLEIKEREDEAGTIEKELGLFWRDKENVRRLIRQTFPEEPAKAIAIAMCESGLNPKAYNPTNRNGSTDGGLWQINSVHDGRLESLGLSKWNPEDATKFARMLYDERGGFSDWVCYTKRMHVAYLR